jgi:hypothetical protein
MSRISYCRIFAGTFILALSISLVCRAAPSTADGKTSVTQVIEMVDLAPTNVIARQVLVAYLAGLRETAGVLVEAASSRNGSPGVKCKKPLSIDGNVARRAVAAAANRTQTPATPLIVHDMLERAESVISD